MQFLSFLQSTFTWLLGGLKWLFGMAAHTTQWPRWVYYALHYGVILLITILLSIFNYELLGDSTTLPPIPVVQDYWAGILFLLTYVFLRLLIYFVSLFWQEDEAEFSDIDRAWGAGLDGLAQAGIDMRKVPVFLVHGIDEAGEPHFFRAAGFSAKVVAPAPDEPSPLRFYGNQDALFIVCSDVSALSAQLRAPQLPALKLGTMDKVVDQQAATLNPESIRRAVASEFSHTLTPGQISQAGPATDHPLVPHAVAPASVGTVDFYHYERRIRHLGQLIRRGRAPVCPINGLLVAVPLDWVRPGVDQGLYQAIAKDVRTLHEALRMVFPVVNLMLGLHQLGPVQELIERVRKTEPAFGPNVRAGAHFPPAHEVDSHAARWVAEKGHEWFRAWIYQAFAHDLANAGNSQLYRFLCQLDAVRPGLVNLLTAAYGQKIFGQQVRLSGCYYAGIEPRTRQYAFVRGVIEKLVRDQELVAYPPALVRQDGQNRQWGFVCCGVVGVLALADVWLLFTSW